MKEINLKDVHQRLTEKIKEYIFLIQKEYGQYMPDFLLKRISSIKDYDSILKIYNYGNVNAFANSKNVCMPLCADRILKMESKFPGYGINKKHRPYNKDNMVINDNTFMTYLIHVFVSGTDAEGYYEDLLLHEVMHYCGSDGGSVLKEGINELLTRMLAQKYDLRTNSCGYPKEVKLVYELMNCFGENVIIRLAFMHDFEKEINFLRESLGNDSADLYEMIYGEAEKEFYDKYYSHIDEFSGVIGIAKKVMFYKKIDYSNIYQMIDDYEKKLNKRNKHI